MAFGLLFLGLLEFPDVAWYYLIGLVLTFLAFCFYLFYNPLPPQAANRWKSMWIRNCFSAMGYISSVGEKLRLGKSLNIARRLQNMFIYYSNVKLFDFSVQTENAEFDGIKVRLYRPRGTQDQVLPGLIYYHGGGWSSLNIDCYDAFLRPLSRQANIVICAVEPRYAPEHVFPEPFFDCLEAAVYFLKNASKYNVNPRRIGMAGDSCGGNFAAAVAIKLAEQHEVENVPPLKHLTLMYPALQGINFKTPSYKMCADRSGPFVLSSPVMVSFWALYALGDDSHVPMFMENKHTTRQFKASALGKIVDSNNLPKIYHDGVDSSGPAYLSLEDEKFAKRYEFTLNNPEFAPLSATDVELRSLPPIYLLTAEFDPLRDDGYFLVKRLTDLRIVCDHMHWGGMEHGFLLFQWYEETKESITNMANVLRQHL